MVEFSSCNSWDIPVWIFVLHQTVLHSQNHTAGTDKKNQLCRLADLIDDNVMPSSWPPALRALIYSHAGLKKCFIAVTDTFRCLAYTAKPPLNETIVSQRDGLCCYSCAQTAPLLTDYKDFSVPPKALCPLLLITLMSIITRRWCGKSKTSIQC